jgi:hypothetical protein
MGGGQGRHKRLAGARVTMLGARLTSAGTSFRRQLERA